MHWLESHGQYSDVSWHAGYNPVHCELKACRDIDFNYTGKKKSACLPRKCLRMSYVPYLLYCINRGDKTDIKIGIHKNRELWVMLCGCVPCLPLSTAEKVAVPVRPKRAATPAHCIPAPLMHSVSKGQSLTLAHSLFKKKKNLQCTSNEKHIYKYTQITLTQNNT